MTRWDLQEAVIGGKGSNQAIAALTAIKPVTTPSFSTEVVVKAFHS
jgi:hypothetical protein